MKSQFSIKEIKRRYLKIVKKYSNQNPNGVNCYKCEGCGHVAKTIDIDYGVTPMFIACTNCSERAVSSFYNDIAQSEEPTNEWYRPDLKFVLKLRSKQNGDPVIEHYLNGGLDYREIEQK